MNLKAIIETEECTVKTDSRIGVLAKKQLSTVWEIGNYLAREVNS